MKNLKKDIKERRKVFETLFQQLDRNNFMDVYQNKNSFGSLYDDENETQAVAEYLKTYCRKLINKALSIITEIRENEEAKKEFLIWFCGRISFVFKQWCPKLEVSGTTNIHNRIEELKSLHTWLNYYIKLKEKNIDIVEEKKKDIMFNDPRRVNETVGWLASICSIYKNQFNEVEFFQKCLNISDEILQRYKRIQEKGLSLSEDYRNIEYYKQANILSENIRNEFQLFELILDRFSLDEASQNEILLMDSFWYTVESIYEEIKAKEIDPEFFLKYYFYDKIQYHGEGNNSMSNRIDFEEQNIKANTSTISQRLLMAKFLGIDEKLAEQNLFENKQKGLILGFLFGELPSSVEKRMTGFERRIKRYSPQNREDIEIIGKIFNKVGLDEFFEERRKDLELIKKEDI